MTKIQKYSSCNGTAAQKKLNVQYSDAWLTIWPSTTLFFQVSSNDLGSVCAEAADALAIGLVSPAADAELSVVAAACDMA